LPALLFELSTFTRQFLPLDARFHLTLLTILLL
jgi:hypothetical protein